MVRQAGNKWVILATVLAMTFMLWIDSSIVNIALPVIARELNVTMGDVQWTVTSYILVATVMMLVCGRLGDMYGKVRIFQIGVVFFTVSSLLCGLAPTLPLLIAARALQGLGMAAAFANNQGIITETFDATERGRALGILVTVAAVGSMLGPSAGGLVLAFLPWEFIFFVNVPVGVLSFVVGLRVLPNRIPEHPARLDVRGSILLVASLMLIVASLTLMQSGVTVRKVGMLAAGVVLLVLFVVVEKRLENPIFPLALLRNKTVVINMFTALVMFFVVGAQNMILPFYFEDALGMSAQQSSLFLTVTPIVTGIMGPIAGSISDKIGCYKPTCFGLLMVTVGEIAFGFFGLEAGVPQIVVGLMLYAVGDGVFNPPNNSLIMGTAPADQLGVVGGLAGFSRNLGQTLGLTVATSVLYASMSAQAGYTVTGYLDDAPDIFITAMHLVFFTVAAVAAAGFVATLLRAREERAATLAEGER